MQHRTFASGLFVLLIASGMAMAQATAGMAPGNGMDSASMDHPLNNGTSHGPRMLPKLIFGPPLLEQSGVVESISPERLVLKNEKEKFLTFKCCSTQLRIAAQPGTPLADKSELTYQDFQPGDVVSVAYVNGQITQLYAIIPRHLKTKGTVISQDALGIVIADSHGKQTRYLCCSSSTTFESKKAKSTTLGANASLAAADVHAGDRVQLEYEKFSRKVTAVKILGR